MEPNETSIFDDLQNQRSLNFASTGQRFANLIVDLLVVYGIVFIIFLVLGILIPDVLDFFNSDDAGPAILDRLITAAMLVIVYTLIEGATKGKTVGKLITGTRAIKEDGSAITWKDAFVRSICRIVPFEIFSGFSGYPWHDKWSKTHVVKEYKTM